ncbi:TolC family protein [Magnetococcales bacterium HHB-1]
MHWNVRYPVKRLFATAAMITCASLLAPNLDAATTSGDQTAAKKTVNQNAQKKTTERENPFLLKDLLGHLETDKDRETYQLLFPALQNQTAQIWPKKNDRKIILVTPQSVLERTVQRNLSLKVARRDPEKAQKALEQLEAVYNPTFNVGINQNEKFVIQRNIFGTLYKKSFTAAATAVPVDPNKTDPQIIEIGYLNQDAATLENALIKVSSPPAPNSGEQSTNTFSLSVNQQLPWGPQISLASVSTYKKVYYSKYKYSYDKPWGTTLSGTLYTPLPFTKDYGDFSPASVILKQGEITRDKSDWSLCSTINSTTLQAELSYWRLVRALEKARMAIKNRMTAEDQAMHTKTLAEARRIPLFSGKQVEAELARTKAAEEQALQQLMSTSSTLSALISDNNDTAHNTLFLPVGFEPFLKQSAQEERFNFKRALTTAQNQHPDLKMTQLTIKSQDLDVKAKENQMLPQIGVTGSGSIAQDNSTYGYHSYLSSLGHMDEPDTSSWNATISWQHQLQQRAAHAALDQSRIYHKDATLAKTDLIQQIQNSVSSTLATYHNAFQQVETAKRTLGSAERAYVNAQERRQAVIRLMEAWAEENMDSEEEPEPLNVRNVSALELIILARNVFNARLNVINALVDAKQAEAQFLSAQGILPRSRATDFTNSKFDKYRVKTLINKAFLPYISCKAKTQ